MRDPASPWTSAIDSLAERACILVEIQKGGTTLHRFALHDADVTWNSATWSATSGEFGQRVAATEIPAAMLKLDNVDKAWNARLSGSTDYRRTKVIVRVVDLDTLESASNVISDYWWVQRWAVDAQSVAFSMSLQVGLLAKRLPGRTYSDNCPWKPFKGTLCGYTGTDSECSFLLEGKHGCREHFGATADKRFGGFPNRPSRLVVGVH